MNASCFILALSLTLQILTPLALRADEPQSQSGDRVPATNSTFPSVIAVDNDAALPAAGLVLHAGSRSTVAVRTGTAMADSGFLVFNTNNQELLRVRSDGYVGIRNSNPQETLALGNGSTNSDFSIATDTRNAVYLGGFRNNGAIAVNRRIRDGAFTRTDLATASIALYTGSADSAIAFNTANANNVIDTERMRINRDGNVGIGTILPRARVHIETDRSAGFGILFRDLADFEPYGSGVAMDMLGNSMIRVSNLEIGWAGNAQISSQGTPLRLNWRADQNVEIGTAGHLSKVVMHGKGGLEVKGPITADSVVNALWQDIAEWVRTDEALPPGTVVIVDPAKDDQVVASVQAYDSRVAGVVSPQPGLVLGVAGHDKVMVATTGRVRVQVDATRHAIARGDLLVSSDRPGMAMKSIPVDAGGVSFHRPGTLIGKALEPLDGGEGEILVLLSLQ